MNQIESLQSDLAMLRAVTRAQGLYFREADPAALFGELLGDLLALTESEYGYIAEVLYDETGEPYLKTWAITNIAWDLSTRLLYEQHVTNGEGLEFRNLDTLFGWGLQEGGRLVISNDRASDRRSAGTPAGHPPLDAYLGVPVMRGDRLVGQFGVSNRPGGYDAELVEWLQPFTVAVANLIDAYRADAERRWAEAARSTMEGRLSAVFEHLSDVVSILGADGSWISSSPAGSRILGYPRGFDPSGGVFDLLHPDDVEPASRAFGEIIAGRRAADEPIDLHVRAADGTYRVLETFGDNLCTDPAVGGVMLTSRDVTASRQVERELRERTIELTTLVGRMREAVLFVDADRNVRFANQSFCDLFTPGSNPEDIVGRETGELLAAAKCLMADPDGFAAGIQVLYSVGEPQLDEVFKMRDGRVLERDHLPISLDDRCGHLWIYRDVTARAELVEERQRLLMQERAMRTAIEEQNRTLLELDHLKNEFVAMVSHELRTPLTSIVAFAELLGDADDSFTAEQRDFLDVIRRNAQRLLALVGDLLLIARIESGALEIRPEPFDLAGVVVDAVGAFRAAAADKGVDVTVRCSDDAASALIDPDRFDQVITNLVSNAVKFTPPGGTVTVTTGRRGSTWAVRVADTGIGIPEAELGELFGRFFRASNAKELELPGTGLGLAIVHAIVALHGGSIEVESSEAGTAFTVLVPAADNGGDREPS